MFQLLQWFQTEGIRTESIKITELTQGCNGVVAIQPIPSDQIIIKIPLHLCIFSDDLLKNHYNRYQQHLLFMKQLQINFISSIQEILSPHIQYRFK